MKKQLVFFNLVGAFAISAVALTCVFASKERVQLNKVDGKDVDYTLTILGKDFTSSESYVSGSVQFVTDATKELAPENQNKVKFNFENCAYLLDTEEYVALQQYGTGVIYNDKTSAIRSLKSLEYTGYGNLLIEWGWYNEGTGDVDYEASTVIGSNGTTYFDYDSPNYVRISSTNYSAPQIEKLVFTYDKSCEASVNPYYVSGGLRYYLYDYSHTASVVGFSGAALEDLVIPSSVNGYDVVEISEDAFAGQTDIETITLPSGLQTIDNGAFDGCSSIEAIEIPNTVTDIGSQSLRGLTSCTSLTFEAGGTELLSIGSSSFESCGHVGVLTLPSRIDYLSTDGYTFNFMNKVTAYALNDDNVENSIVSVADGVLFANQWGDKYLISYPDDNPRTEYTIPSDVTKINSNDGFSNANHLVTLNIAPAAGKTLNFGSYSAESMESLVNLNLGGEGNIVFYWYCLRCAPLLKSVVIPTNVRMLDAGFGSINDDALAPLALHLVASEIPDNWNDNWDGGDVASGYITVDYNYVA